MLLKIMPMLLLFPFVSVAAKEKCKVIITASDGMKPYELVVEKKGVDPKDSKLRTKLESGIYECEVESDVVDLQSVVDFGELSACGRTARTVDFFVENGATVRVHFDGNTLMVDSDGPEFLNQKRMQEAGKEWMNNRISQQGLNPDDLTEEQQQALRNEYNHWELEYYKANPMLAFLLKLSEHISYFNVGNHRVSPMLDLYHRTYEPLYPAHPAHGVIAAAESDDGLQICGRPYHDYTAYNIEGAEVKASDYYTGKPTLVICWATWCLSCRQEAKDLIPIVEKYRGRGLNAFSLAREFNSADNLKKIVTEDNYPWPCLLDLDDKFQIFNNHGATSSALLLIDADGKIAASGYEWADVEPAMKRIFPD